MSGTGYGKDGGNPQQNANSDVHVEAERLLDENRTSEQVSLKFTNDDFTFLFYVLSYFTQLQPVMHAVI